MTKMKMSLISSLIPVLARHCATQRVDNNLPHGDVHVPSRENSCFLAMQQLFPRVVAIFLLLLVSGGVWAARTAQVSTAVTPTGSGYAYISTSNTIGTNTQASQENNNNQGTQNKTFYIKAVATSGYVFDHWEFVSPDGTTSIANSTSTETTITVQTAGSNNQTRNNTIQAVFKVEGSTYVGYVITSSNSHFLGGTSTTDITTFNPNTCIWTGSNGNKWQNAAGYYLRMQRSGRTNYTYTLSLDQTNSTNFSLTGSESGTTGQKIDDDSYSRYVRYNNGWTQTGTSTDNVTNVVFAVSKKTFAAVENGVTNPTISAAINSTNDGVQMSHTNISGTITPSYEDYIFYNGTHHYWYDGSSHNAAPSSVNLGSVTPTYTWSISSGSEYATIDATTGNMKSKGAATDGQKTVTVKLTTTYAAAGYSNEQTYDVVIQDHAVEPATAGIGDYNIINQVGGTLNLRGFLSGNGNYIPAYSTYTVNNQSHILYNGKDCEYTAPAIYGSDGCTYAWSLSGEGASYASLSSNEGQTPTLTYNTDAGHDVVVIVNLTVTHTDFPEFSATATYNVTLYSTTIVAPTITFDGASQVTLSVPSEGATYYTTDGSDPKTSETKQEYTGPFNVSIPTTVKAYSERWEAKSDVSEKTLYAQSMSAPTIEFSTGGEVTISSNGAPTGTVYYYTTDGSEPTESSATYNASSKPTVSNLTTVKAIAVCEGYNNSASAEKLFIQTGVSDGVVTLNDYEDHNWTYYKGVDSEVDGGNYNTRYKGKLYSPKPRNVKITYNGVNSVNSSTTVVKVSTKENEGQNSFVYYKTLEQGTTPDEYPYQVISNPFSVRPSTGSGTSKTYYGFAGWKIVSGGDYIKDHSNNDVLDLDEEIVFENLPYPSVNCTSAEIVFETTWEQAHVQRGGANVSHSSFDGGNYETNFCVINANYSSALAPSYPVTITSVEPDGSSTYNVTFSNLVTPVTGAANTTKLEYMTWNPSGNIDARGRNLTIGRGVTTGGTARELYGTNQTAGATNVIDQVLKIESGNYSYFRHFTSSGTNRIRKQIVVFGCDYDRAKVDNTKLSITGRMIGSEGSGAANESGTHDANLFMSKTYMKSGTFMSSVALSGAGYQNSYYLGINAATGATGKRFFEMEGGDLQNSIAGGMDVNMNGTKDSDQYINVYIRIRGGHVKGCIYGAARYAESQGSRQIILTGGEVNSWIAGGANGDETTQGATTGASYIYVGGNAKVGGEGSETSIGSSIGGCVYGAGCGYGPNSTSGNMVLGTNVVVADNAYIERGVYGGGAFGYCATDKTANIYITGGHVEGKSGNYKDRAGTTTNNIIGGVFGGARMRYGGSANIYMTGGWVETGVYGGSNYTGTMNGDVKMVITGGQVGTDATHTGNVHGGGYGSGTVISGNVDITLGKTGAARDADGVTVYGDVYGGSALGSVNGTAATTTYHTNVTMNAGYIHGSLYGGALGDASTAANVYGPVAVTINGGKVIGEESAVYGCNNVNGAPQRAVSVTVNHTDSHNDNGTENNFVDDIYAINAVYGGGNRAPYTYGIPTVTVNNCDDNSIKYVYGGGNQATVPSTSVTINGGDVIGNVFGGGNDANITGTNIADANKGTRVNITGGRILNVYGGNNNGGTITGTIKVDVAEGSSCSVNVDDLYGGGNKAASNAGTITIGKCSRIDRVFGGANQADVTGPINLTITDGHINNVFGGNNNSGNITGAITVNVEWASGVTSNNASLGNVYGGGNIASYSAYGYNADGTPKTTGNKVAGPTVNIKNATTTGSVFGGGKGKDAVVYGDPVVNIGQWGSGEVIIGEDVFGGGDLAAVEGNPTVTVRNCGTIINRNLYGGGNAAPVYSTNTTVWGGTILGNVFGGGNGEDATKNEKGAQVGYKRDDTTAGDGDGDATTNIFGGTIGTWKTVDGVESCTSGGGVFGGSNTTGNIRGKVVLTLDQRTETGEKNPTNLTCDLKLKEVYGSGNEAAYAGTGITFNLGCVEAMDEVYGGAKNADMNGDIQLNITSGHFKRVFGGNNLGGCVKGSITVNIDELGCHPIIIDELYGCGNNAAYSVYGYGSDGSILTSGDKQYGNGPQVNVISCTQIGQIFGGGLGADAKVAGDTHVNIHLIEGVFANGDTSKGIQAISNKWGNQLGTIGTVFGGGSQANVIGDTYVNICTEAKVGHLIEEDPTNKPGKMIQTNVDADKEVGGVNISGNVYGGGSRADVTGKTHVQVGAKKTTGGA